jgi:hypothetical protein
MGMFWMKEGEFKDVLGRSRRISSHSAHLNHAAACGLIHPLESTGGEKPHMENF